MHKLISVCVLMSCVGGCIIPLPSKVTAGHEYTEEGIAFLNLPNTTREEVLSTLGEPLLEVSSPGVLLYAWETTSRTQVSPPDNVGGIQLHAHSFILKGDPCEWGLFVAYDERGYVTAHEVRKIGTAELDQACVEWQQSKTRERR
jgi:hypothetical protein